MIEVLLIVAALALVAACGAFVAAEFAFVTVNRPAVERAAEEGDSQAAGVLSAGGTGPSPGAHAGLSGARAAGLPLPAAQRAVHPPSTVSTWPVT